MKFGPNIVRKVADELRKIPNIRHVSAKMGIDHSTFYRWMVKHAEFHKMVEAALMVGRERITDAAESVIFNGIQNGDMRASMYWLAHNSERYIPEERVRYFQYLENNLRTFLKNPVPDDSVFESLFKGHLELERLLGQKSAAEHMAPLVAAACHIDPALIEIYQSAYLEWKNDELSWKEKVKECYPFGTPPKLPDLPPGNPEEDEPSHPTV